MNFADVSTLIASGQLDDELGKLKTMVDSRMSELRVHKKAEDFGVGDEVIFNSMCGTRYLVGERATVVGRKVKKVVVKLHKPQGRFVRMVGGEIQSPEITVPVGIIDPA